MDLRDVLATTAQRRGDAPAVVDRTNGRIELGHRTLGNWAAKATNLWIDELELEPGSVVEVGAGVTPWLAAVTAVGTWTAGLAVGLGVDARAVGVLGEGVADTAATGVRLRAGSGLSGRLSAPAEDADDLAAEVLACGDEVIARHDPGMVLAGTPGSVSGERLLAAAAALSDWLSLSDGGRLVVALAPETPDGAWLTALVACLARGGALIAVDPAADATTIDRITEEERADQAIAATGATGVAGWADAPPAVRLGT